MSKTKVMIVEDEIISAMAMSQEFHDFGYVVTAQVSSGEDALEEVEKLRPEIVIMDLNLKGEMDGIETAKQIKSRFGIPILYVTGYPDEEMRNEANVVDPIGYFVKPVAYDEIESTIDNAMNKKHKRANVRKKKRAV